MDSVRKVLVVCICAFGVWGTSCGQAPRQKQESGAANASQQVPPSGEVKGTLVLQDGSPAQGVDVILGTMLDEKAGKMRINTTWQSPVDKSGGFSIKGLAPAKYGMVLFLKQRAAFATVLKKGKPLTFAMPEDRGVNLGRIDVSSVGLIPSQ
jgi:hypothetical protein